MMQISSLKIVAAIFVAGFVAFPFPKQGRTQEPPVQQTKVDEAQLRAFAKVYVAVQKIRQSFEPRLKQAQGPDAGQQIQREAVSRIQAALTQEGLTEESYVQIFEVARADDALRKRLLQMIDEERTKS